MENRDTLNKRGCFMYRLLAVLLTVVFVTLKLTNIIAWSWWLVLCPIPILIAIGLTFVITGIGLLLLTKLLS
jgi:hypothetical protein